MLLKCCGISLVEVASLMQSTTVYILGLGGDIGDNWGTGAAEIEGNMNLESACKIGTFNLYV